MKKNYLPPQIKNKLLMKGAGGKDGGRVEVEIPGCGSMVLPDTYEPEKFERPESKTVIPDASDIGTKVQKETTQDDLLKLRFAKMMREVDKLKTITSDIESYRQVIEAAHRSTYNSQQRKSVKNLERKSSGEVPESLESQLSLVSIVSRDKIQ